MVEADDDNSLSEEEYFQCEVLCDDGGEERDGRQLRWDSQQHQEDHQTEHCQSWQGSWGRDEASEETDEGEEIIRDDVSRPEHLASPFQVQTGCQA